MKKNENRAQKHLLIFSRCFLCLFSRTGANEMRQKEVYMFEEFVNGVCAFSVTEKAAMLRESFLIALILTIALYFLVLKISDILYVKDGMTVEQRCLSCSKVNYMVLTSEAAGRYLAYMRGKGKINDMFPELNPLEQEFLRIGCCPSCQRKYLKSNFTSTRIKEDEK